MPGARPIARILGYAVQAVLLAAALAIAWRLLAALGTGEAAAYFEQLWRGLQLTLFITATTFTAGFVLALVLAAASVPNRSWRARVVSAYAALFRNSPLIAQLYLVYYGAGEFSRELASLGLWWLFRDPLPCVLLVFTLNTAAYQVHVLRGAMASLAGEQTDAARALGLGPLPALFKIVLPQALRLAARPLGNELTQMTKASSIASTVTVFDLLSAARLAYNDTLNFDVYLVAAAIYIVLVEAVRRSSNRLVAHLTRHERRAA